LFREKRTDLSRGLKETDLPREKRNKRQRTENWKGWKRTHPPKKYILTLQRGEEAFYKNRKKSDRSSRQGTDLYEY
jgi:hypothetical protein